MKFEIELHAGDERFHSLVEFLNLNKIDYSHPPVLQQHDCSALREFIVLLNSNVMSMKSKEGLSDRDQRYIGGQELICSLVLQQIDKLSPVA